MDHGFFGMAFDFDFNGHLNNFERAADFAMFMNVMEESERTDLWDDDDDPDDYDF